MNKKCPKLEKCPFFLDEMADKPGTAAIYKKSFCLGDNSDCARLMVSRKLGPKATPKDLYPNQKKRALDLIEEDKK